MVYTKSNLIETVDFNDFVGTPTGTPSDTNKTLQPFASDVEAALRVAAIYGIGYGQRGYGQTDVDLPAVATDDLAGTAEWTALRLAIENAANHQGTSTALLPPVNLLELGDLIVAHDGITDSYNLPQMIIDIDNVANRFNVASPAIATSSTVAYGSAWSVSATITVTATFTSEDEARHYFNSGGKLRFDLDHPAGSPQDNAWNTILNNYVGTVDIDYTSTTVTGSKGSTAALGYYDLTGSFQAVYTGTDIGDAPYTVNDVLIEARATSIVGLNGGNGTAIEVRFTLSDDSTGSSDTVSVGTDVTPALVKTSLLTITSPTWSNGGWSGS